MIKPFRLPFSPEDWNDLRTRVRRTRWPDGLSESWQYGTKPAFLRELCAFWEQEFDWKAQLDRLSEFPHFQFQTAEGNIHFLHVRGKGQSPIPLVLTHGWPGSFIEMLRIIPLLTDPASHGLPDGITFDVVVPSLPGFGYSSGFSSTGMDAFRVADLWAKLMRALGYERFAAQGGDIGAAVSTALGLRHRQRMIGIHLNYIPGSYRPYVHSEETITASERQFLTDAATWYDQNGAYAHLQGTKPQTLAYGLSDSPAGLAAWLMEKFQTWSDCYGDPYKSFSRDWLLTNLTLYWTTQTALSSFWMYQGGRLKPLHFQLKDRVTAPCAIAVFPKEIMTPPRSWVERGYNVKQWTEMPRGGHFAAAEEPELLASDIRAFFRVVDALA